MEARPQGGVRQSDGFAPQPQGAFLAERRDELGRAVTDELKVFGLQEEEPVVAHSVQLYPVRQLRVALLPEHPAVPGPRPELTGEPALQVLVCLQQEERLDAPQAELCLVLQVALQLDAGLRQQGRSPME